MSKQLLLFFFILFSLALPIFGQITPPSQSPSIACKSSLYPKLCRSLLSAFQHSPSNPNDYSKFSVKQCQKNAGKLSNLIAHFLTTQKGRALFVNTKEISALNDCHQLSELTVDYLESISAELKAADGATTSDALVGKIQTLLSAVVTNQQTCYEGLKEAGSSMVAELLAPLSNAAEIYSVSLGLVAHALGRVRKPRKTGGLLAEHRGLMEEEYWARDSRLMASKVKQASERSYQRGGRILDELVENGVHINQTVTVSPYGGCNFTSIGEAIAFAPNNSKIEDGYFLIYAKQGYYEEYVVVAKNKKNIMLIGEGVDLTVIAGNRSVIDGWTTYNSATFAVSGERFVAINITFKNLAGPWKHQAVALRNNADLSTFYRCRFEGYQDTLYTHSLRQFYRECDIYGTVDFIFGNAAAIFQNCNMFARKPMPDQKNIFTAQGRSDPNQNTGISIQNCTIQAAPDLAQEMNLTLSFLGRPWHNYSRTVIMQSYIGDVIAPVGWLEWNGTNGLDTLYYGEFENYGPGANTTTRVQWPGYNLMNATQAMNFTVYNFTMGDTWLPFTNVPFSQGL
ncbi:PREDICTED: probable pectinesterase/pectinesterase inhibitor 25 [Nicotiana attenuata]|uniref:Pectinesterase n=1 Tax=Nicotiana attenuata TaxID=49451 RepID=A0A314KUM0_NICAT|nr:PREDICTED: probable pectinesterase/pectinesterase inhibitor 25 [Nicotiana attenuata]OIT33191.1 putative pectinesterasepectinesterase inhibitor 25 [Nicotiana attenuata]